MYTGVSTIYGAAVQVAQQRGAPHDIWPNSSISEAIKRIPEAIAAGNRGMWITPDYSYLDTREIKIACVCIGNGGHRLLNGGAQPFFEPRPHSAKDAGLFSQIPFVVKPIGADLNAAERARFCLRETLLINGALYAAYFGRVIADTDITAISVTERVITPDTDVTSEWRPTAADLSPPMNDDDPWGNTTQVYVNATYIDQIQMTEQDVTWLREAALLLYGTESKAYISEIAVVGGVRKAVTQRYDNNGSNPTAYSGPFEVVGAQVNSYSYAEWSMAAHPTGFIMGVSTSCSEPLFAKNE